MLAFDDNLYGIGPAEELHLGGRIDIQITINEDDIPGFVSQEIKYKGHSGR